MMSLSFNIVFVQFLLLVSTTQALYEEDAGKLDFRITTAGHGPVTFASMSIATPPTPATNTTVVGKESVIVTAGSASCYVAGRDIGNGQVRWRRSVASATTTTLTTNTNSNQGKICSVVVVGNVVISVDRYTIRGWNVDDGALLWDRQMSAVISKVWMVDSHYVALTFEKSSDVQVLQSISGESVDSPSSKEADSVRPNDDYTKVVCAEGATSISIQENSLVVISNGVTVGKITDISVDRVFLVECTNNRSTVLASSNRGTTSIVRFTNDNAATEIIWTVEEGLAQITTALMLDASHESYKRGQEQNMLQLSSRLVSQWNAMKSLVTYKSATSHREHLFGFVKIAVLLSGSANRVFGVETWGDKRGSIRFQVDLPDDALWHRIIHGSANAEKGIHGINGGAHTRELLILSNKGTTLEWLCMDGTSGETKGKGSMTLVSPVAQIIPLVGKGKCRQDAILLLENESIVKLMDDQVSDSRMTDLYAHYVEKNTSTMKSFAISNASTNLVGSVSFPGEEIIALAYPPREEVIQSSSVVLGDDSLLLKYLNPHLAAIATADSSNGADKDDGFFLSHKPKSKRVKRKPVGVTQPTTIEASLTDEKPNFYMNLVDTVSGRLLYRVSHANVQPSPRSSVLVSENWIFYTFTNSKTRKVELGVLTLYEGMIDRNGLTAFSKPEQTTSFSSLDAREKPIVLAKVFTIPTAVTALGMTTTRSGISGRQLILAGLDGSINTIPRKMIEPRRPLGPLKETEKKEGLVQYHELIQTVSYMSLSYNQTIESVKCIISVPTDVESQTLILAFGGPDIFFTRTSPSNGFDLLPDNFNRILLSIVVAGLVVALLVLRQMESKKILKQGWV